MICVPLKLKSTSKLLIELRKTQKVADIIEIWFDELDDLSDEIIKKIFKIGRKPYIYKSSGEIKKLEKILPNQPQYIDLDLSTVPQIIKKVKKLSPKTKIILSFHDFKKTPEIKHLRKIIKKMQQKGADIYKIATLANSFSDSLLMLSLLKESTLQNKKAIFLCMGKEGTITRTAGHLFGNYLMYAPLDIKESTAPGQISVRELNQLIKCR